MTTIKIKNPKELNETVESVKLAMFLDRADEIRGISYWQPMDGIRFNVMTSGSFHSTRVIGIQFSIHANGKTFIRKVMIKDGEIDIDKCLAKFAELKALAEQEAIKLKATQQVQDTLSAEVDEFYRSTPVPPGFVIRNYGGGKWTVEYKNTVDKETLRRVVLAVKGAIDEGRV